MYFGNVTLTWLCLTVFCSCLVCEIHCQNGLPATHIQYDREFLLYLADRPSSIIRPPDLPEWVPTREDPPLEENARRRGKRGGIRQRVRRRGHRTPLPTITLSNVRSITNKIDELRANVSYDHAYRNSSLICITETWLCSDIQSNNIEINGFYSMRLDRCLEERGKKKGGLCIYVNKQWCSNITNRSSISSKDIELMCVSFRPFYLPREFPQVNVLLVYIPPSSDKENAKQIIQEQVNELGIQSADAPVIILGDFNHCDLKLLCPIITNMLI